MKGYLLNFYKHSPLREEMLGDSAMRNVNSGTVRNVVWSTFDRLEIREVKDFKLFRQPGESEKKWVGERQFSMIYEVGEDARMSFVDYSGTDKYNFAFKPLNLDENVVNQYRFFGISIIDFTSLAYNEFFSKENSMRNAREIILNVLDDLCNLNGISKEKICYEIYGSLGGNDAVIIWIANQFKDIMLLAEALRSSTVKNLDKGIISNIYTILGICNFGNKNVNFDDVEGEFHIRLTKRAGYNITEFKKELKALLKTDVDDKIYTVAGEHDITIIIPGNIMVASLYCNDGLIHMEKPSFYENFIQSNTEVCVKKDLSNIKTVRINIDYKEDFAGTHNTHNEDIYELVDKICKSNMLKQTPYLGDTLWILYSDYLKNITSAFSYPWTQDLYYQFFSCLKCFEFVTEQYESQKFNVENYEYIEIIIKNLRQIILHIAQANRIFFEVPNTHLKNTGTYSKILRAYQGITKTLIKQAYLIPKRNLQTEIIPFINFDSIPIPISNSYNIASNNKLLVEIRLPYEALVNVNQYTYLLAHEIFHYIAPTDRKTRNEILCALIFSILTKLVIQNYFSDYLAQKGFSIDDHKKFKELIDNCVSKYTLYHILKHFDRICRLIENYDVTKSRNDYLSDINKFILNVASSDVFCKIMYEAMTEYSYADFIENIENTRNYADEEVDNKVLYCQISQQLINHISNVKFNKDFLKFHEWIRQKAKFDDIKNCIIKVEKALIEIMPDFYMVQVTQMSSKVYYEEILRIRNILYPNDKNIDIQLRMALIYNYCFIHDSNKRARNISPKEWENDLYDFVRNLDVSEEKKEYLWNDISGVYDFINNYDQLFSEYFSLLRFNEYENDSDFSKALDDIKNKIKVNDDFDFAKNIECIESFQLQESIENLKGYIQTNKKQPNYSWKNMPLEEKEFFNREDDSPIAEDFNTLIAFLDSESQKIIDHQQEEIWYRGHERDTYQLIPSLYRMKDGQKFYDSSLREMMDTLYKSFRVMSYSVPEIFSGGNDSIIGTMASMQHYSLPTNILDWTPSVLNAIYFAIESIALQKENGSKNEDGELWLLNPVRLNECRKNLYGVKQGLYPIPYIMSDDEETAKPYLPFYKCENDVHKSHKLPMAIRVPHVNQRIKAQSGTFTIFNLDIDEPAIDGSKDFSMYSMYYLQKQIEKDKSYKDFKPFIKKVRISKNAKQNIAKRLQLMGIHKHTIYPELENIVIDFKKQLKDFIENEEKNK